MARQMKAEHGIGDQLAVSWTDAVVDYPADKLRNGQGKCVYRDQCKVAAEAVRCQ